MKLTLLILALLIAGCAPTKRVIKRQNELYAVHLEKVKKPKKDRKKEKFALGVTAVVLFVWVGLYQNSNTN